MCFRKKDCCAGKTLYFHSFLYVSPHFLIVLLFLLLLLRLPARKGHKKEEEKGFSLARKQKGKRGEEQLLIMSCYEKEGEKEGRSLSKKKPLPFSWADFMENYESSSEKL